MKLIVGLGNPGPKYAGTRHNVGFLAAARLAREWTIRLAAGRCGAKMGESVLGGEKIRLALPQMMMNASGESVGCLLRCWKVDPAGLLVICDDVALPLGTIRIRSGGSDGGHNGLHSVIQAAGTEQVARLRVGIRTQRLKAGDMVNFVLGRFTVSEKKQLEGALDLAVEACEVWVTRGVSAAMNQFNRRVKCQA